MPPVVAFVFTHRIQYFINVLDELDRCGRVKPVAIYAHDTAAMNDAGFGRQISWDNRSAASFKEILLPNRSGRSHNGFFGSLSPKLASTLRELKPSAVHLNGFAKAIQWQGLRWARRWDVPILLRGDGDTLSERASSFSSRAFLARYFTSRASHVFFQGEQNRKYWLARGADPKRMSWLPCVSDTAVFQRAAFTDANFREQFRQAHGAGPADLVLVVSGKLDARKRPADALHLLPHLNLSLNRGGGSSSRSPIRIWFLGSGPLEPELKSLASELGVAEQTHFWGFRNQSEMPEILQAADVLLHLSEADPWPYSVLDAAASGLALLLSDRTGSYPEWQMPPAACEVFRCGDIAGLAEAVKRLSADAGLRQGLQRAAKTRSRLYTESEFNFAFEAATRGLLKNQSRPD